MSSLASQLRVLSSNNSSSSNTVSTSVKSFKSRSSFLFSSSQSSETDEPTIIGLAQSGLSQLSQFDVRFSAFEKSLFSPHPFDRAGQTKNTLMALNQSVNSFLLLLSPYFLLPSAHKVLELLIRRYGIHQHSVPALLSCTLPYCDHPIFARLLQIIVLPPTFQWMKNAQTNGSPITRQTLIQRCIEDGGILMEFIATTASTAIATNKAAMNLYVSTVIDVINTSRKLNETFLMKLWPFLAKALEEPKNKKEAATG